MKIAGEMRLWEIKQFVITTANVFHVCVIRTKRTYHCGWVSAGEEFASMITRTVKNHDR